MKMWVMAYILFVMYLLHKTSCYASSVPEGCWPDNIIPFKISHGFNDSQIYFIHDIIGEFNRFTCIRWVDGDKVPYNATEYVVFQKVEQKLLCHAQRNLLANGGEVTTIQLGDLCFQKSLILHEMMHVLGFSHEHQRADRHCYVIVSYHGVDVADAINEFDVKHERWVERFPYDKLSVMQYPTSSVMRVVHKTQTRQSPIVNTDEPLGNTSGKLSFLDTWKILYKFCGFSHFCDVFPEICFFMDQVEQDCKRS